MSYGIGENLQQYNDWGQPVTPAPTAVAPAPPPENLSNPDYVRRLNEMILGATKGMKFDEYFGQVPVYKDAPFEENPAYSGYGTPTNNFTGYGSARPQVQVGTKLGMLPYRTGSWQGTEPGGSTVWFDDRIGPNIAYKDNGKQYFLGLKRGENGEIVPDWSRTHSYDDSGGGWDTFTDFAIHGILPVAAFAVGAPYLVGALSGGAIGATLGASAPASLLAAENGIVAGGLGVPGAGYGATAVGTGIADLVGSDWALGQATGPAGGMLPTTAEGLTAANTAAAAISGASETGATLASLESIPPVETPLPEVPTPPQTPPVPPPARPPAWQGEGDTAPISGPNQGVPGAPGADTQLPVPKPGSATPMSQALNRIRAGVATASDYAQFAKELASAGKGAKDLLSLVSGGNGSGGAGSGASALSSLFGGIGIASLLSTLASGSSAPSAQKPTALGPLNPNNYTRAAPVQNIYQPRYAEGGLTPYSNAFTAPDQTQIREAGMQLPLDEDALIRMAIQEQRRELHPGLQALQGANLYGEYSRPLLGGRVSGRLSKDAQRPDTYGGDLRYMADVGPGKLSAAAMGNYTPEEGARLRALMMAYGMPVGQHGNINATAVRPHGGGRPTYGLNFNYSRDFVHGGIAELGHYSDGGRMLKGPGDGMSDSIPATIGGKQPARLADGEFVVPADVVSHLGNGSTDAGAKQLYAMMDRIRKARTGTPKQGKQINPNKYLPG